MFKKVVVGGTFDRLHKGHESLLTHAFEIGSSVVIGLTSDEFADRFRTKKVRHYNERMESLKKLCDVFKKDYQIIEISDSYGVATIDDLIDSIVVSEETLLRAQEINTIRYKKGLGKLVIVVVPLVVDERGRPLSSSDEE